MKRVSFGIFLLIFAFIFPWWVSFLLAILGAFYFENLYEMILVGFIIDMLYGAGPTIFGIDLFFTLILLIAFYFITNFRKKLLI